MRPIFLALAAVLLAGCASDPQLDARYRNLLPLGRSAERLPVPEFLAARQARAPSLAGAVESRPETIGIFLRQRRANAAGVSTWIGTDGAQLLLQDGILVGTRGFGADVMASDVSESAALIHGLGSGTTTRVMTLLDGDDHAVSRALRCTIAPYGTDTVPLRDRTVTTRTMTETCRNADIQFSNYYWVVPGSGEILQSSQWAGELTQKISLRVYAR
ncbi:hypothetical protein EOW65_16095 [Sinirhodobacter ferrireducens]|uniref:YjbF family lipoprotein n=1 Tax=Paenirhodobacter ferrireducens TaxID=1215032 RepID=A0A443L9C4_9RHOB|nr:YjbF family lipoprotein [Sinirhodobacter ferrireducens]RWR45753.1 hypothetical protein EOW65_16095 [Sinirhodobacter ferrireducens]